MTEVARAATEADLAATGAPSDGLVDEWKKAESNRTLANRLRASADRK